MSLRQKAKIGRLPGQTKFWYIELPAIGPGFANVVVYVNSFAETLQELAGLRTLIFREAFARRNQRIQ